MSTPQPQPQTPNAASSTPWTNPVDAPPPFPNAPTGPYASYGEHENQTYAPLSNAGARQHVTSDERLWAIAAHLSAAIAWVVSAGWLSFVGPLVVYLLQKDKSRFVRNASAGAFNFAVSMAIVSIVGWILTITVVGAVIGLPMIAIGGIGSLVLGVIGAIKASQDEAYTYPMQLQILN